MKLDTYTQFAHTEHDFSETRIIVVPNADAAQRLIAFYTDCVRVPLQNCISENEAFLSMPDVVFSRLTEKIRLNEKLSIVTGLHAYILLLNPAQREIAFARLKQLVDSNKDKTIFLIPAVWKNELEKMFANPGYKSSKQLVYLDGNVETKNIEVLLVDDHWINVQPPDCHSFREYLETIGDFPQHADGKIVVALPDNNRKIAGLNDTVKQVHSLADCMRQFYGVDENLPDEVLQWILDMSRQFNVKNAINALRKVFFDDELSNVLVVAPKKIIDEQDGIKRSAMIWYLKHAVKKDSYLYAVLSAPDSGGEAFFAAYVSHAVGLLKDTNAELTKKFAEERKAALKEIGERKKVYIRQFIEQTKGTSLSLVSAWLNNDTPAEHEEFIRRFAESHLPKAYTKLDMYLAEYDYGTEELASYFKRYRRFKLRNNVDEKFCKDAYDLSFADVSSRDSELPKYTQDNKTALLVVDAMGAEYLPLIVGLAPLYSLKIEKHGVVLAQYPTSTAFNPIECFCKKFEIKTLDNIVHNGVRQHQTNEYYENIAAVLDTVFPDIFAIIVQHMSRFDRIILTADHGASRLAVLAHDMGFATTLDNPSNEKPDDWRYVKTPQGKHCPNEFVETLDGNYWVVRGYNRLPKQGGKQYELHGGYTPEECLVPFVVFSKSAAATPPKAVQKQIKQIVEKDDFSI